MLPHHKTYSVAGRHPVSASDRNPARPVHLINFGPVHYELMSARAKNQIAAAVEANSLTAAYP